MTFIVICRYIFNHGPRMLHVLEYTFTVQAKFSSRNSNIFWDSSLIRETEVVANFKGKSLLQHLTQMGTLIKSPTKYFTVGYENTRNFRKNMSLGQDFLLHYKDELNVSIFLQHSKKTYICSNWHSWIRWDIFNSLKSHKRLFFTDVHTYITTAYDIFFRVWSVRLFRWLFSCN